MKKIELLKELEKYPVFNIKKIRDISGKDSNYAKLLVYRLKKDNLIYEIEKNKYTLQNDIFVIASRLIWPSYISLWSALNYNKLTEQIPQVISIITIKRRKNRNIIFNNVKIEFIKVKPKYFFGYKKERLGDFDIFIAEKEKAILDSILLRKVSVSEIYEIIKGHIQEININILISYLIKLKNKALIKRLGIILEKCGVDKYNNLKRFIDYKYISLDFALEEKGKKNKKWRIIDNVDF